MLVKVIMWVIRKDSIIAYFFPFPLLTDLKGNCIKQHEYDCIVRTIIYRKTMYLTVTAQSSRMEKMYWNKEILGSKSNPRDQIKSTRRVNNISKTNTIYFISFFPQPFKKT